MDDLNNNLSNLTEAENTFDKTQEMDSVQFSGGQKSITSKNQFIDLNTAEDMSRTLRMDSIIDDETVEPIPVANPIKRRRRKKKQTNHTRTMGQIFLGVVISVAAICLGSVMALNVIQGLRDITGMAKDYKEYDIVITESMSIDDIVDTLHSNGMILNSRFFKTYLNYKQSKDNAKPILTGLHTIRSNMSYGNLIYALTTEKTYVDTVMVLIPEGSTAYDIGQLLEKNLVCRAEDFEKYYASKINSYDFEEEVSENENRFYALEGYLFPDTYEFYVVDDIKDNPNLDTSKYAKMAADTMYKNFESKITSELKERMKELGMTLDETITLASLIQREGTNEDNMGKISSVFHNRLDDSEYFPQLQSDTTYTYIERYIEPNITSSNADKIQAVINAYDTYQCVGLPAGPICCPGMDAINAALYPENTDYYYFLASKDGIFYYAKTLAQHEQNILDAALRENSGE